MNTSPFPQLDKEAATTPKDDFMRETMKSDQASRAGSMAPARSADSAPAMVKAGGGVTGLDLFMSDRLNSAGNRVVSGADKATGSVFGDGRYKGMSSGEAINKIRGEYENSPDRARFEAEAARINGGGGSLPMGQPSAMAANLQSPVSRAPSAKTPASNRDYSGGTIEKGAMTTKYPPRPAGAGEYVEMQPDETKGAKNPGEKMRQRFEGQMAANLKPGF